MEIFSRVGRRIFYSLEKLIEEMVENDIKEAKKEFLLNKEGFNVNVPQESPPNN